MFPGTVAEVDPCMGPGGSYAYRGTQSSTKSGKTCQNWSKAEPQANTYSEYYTDESKVKGESRTGSGSRCITNKTFLSTITM